jgi:hypothetical protein
LGKDGDSTFVQIFIKKTNGSPHVYSQVLTLVICIKKLNIIKLQKKYISIKNLEIKKKKKKEEEATPMGQRPKKKK